MEGLPGYVYLVKNLRGVYAGLEDDDHELYVSWLARRFRYRDLGVAPSLVEAAMDVFERFLGGKPFHVLGYPTERLAAAARRATEALADADVPRVLVESLLLSLVYASPLLVTGNAYRVLEEAGLVIHVVRGPALGLQDARLHMRIAGYSALDFLVPTAEAVIERIQAGSLGELYSERRGLTEKDAKRYWRIAGKGDKPVIAYLDHLPLLGDTIRNLVGPEERILLALPVAFILDSVEDLANPS
ncbi:hypothetical protein Pdsh_10210 [Pyrodictium delaneyi]|uniref:Uncharacterized protein n=1 Tax=Pyrodictium delaneyi TaxID=1273541 RepID=A0A211YL80_9CREN|nr:hypothetical protein Pdsh_10210 [Pyrodictium delaneyi]